MTTENKAEDKKTFLILHVGDKKEIFLEAAKTTEGQTYFKNGPLRGWLGSRKDDGSLTGAVNLQLSVADGKGGYNNVDAGVVFRKDGEKGAFLSGYVGGVTTVPGTKDGVTFTNLVPVSHTEDGKTQNTVSVTADVRGPDAEAILAALPVVARPAKTADADATESKPRSPKP